MLKEPTGGGFDWDYWQRLVPTAYFCSEADILVIVLWCTVENLYLACHVDRLVARGSKMPLALAVASGVHACLCRNPVLIGVAAYLLSRTGVVTAASNERHVGLNP